MPPELGAALRHMLAVDEDDFDCAIELVFPLTSMEAIVDAAVQDIEALAAQQTRQPEQGEGPLAEAEAAEAPADATAVVVESMTVTCRASSVALKQHSEVFRCAQLSMLWAAPLCNAPA